MVLDAEVEDFFVPDASWPAEQSATALEQDADDIVESETLEHCESSRSKDRCALNIVARWMHAAPSGHAPKVTTARSLGNAFEHPDVLICRDPCGRSARKSSATRVDGHAGTQAGGQAGIGYDFLYWFKRASGARARCGRRWRAVLANPTWCNGMQIETPAPG